MMDSNQGEIESLHALQDYLSNLFDDLSELPLIRRNSSIAEICQIALRYGKKVMELSQQCTAQYRNQHYLSRQKVQSQLTSLYHALQHQHPPSSLYEELMPSLMERAERPSTNSKASIPESRLALTELKTDSRHRANPPEASTHQSRVSKRKYSSKSGNVKEILSIKECFEKEEECMRMIFDKMRRMIEGSGTGISEEGCKFMRAEGGGEKVGDIVKAHTESNCSNLRRISKLTQVMTEQWQKQLRREGTAQSRLEIVLDEAQRVEQIHSYSLSALLQQLSDLSKMLNDSPSLCPQQVAKAQSTAEQLYGLFPGKQTLLEVAYVKTPQPSSLCNQGIQVSLLLSQNERKTSSQGFRVQVRIQESVERLERMIKFKKTVDVKEVEKAIGRIRENLTIKASSQGEAAFSEEYRRIAFQQEQVLRDIEEGQAKRLRQADKRISEAETATAKCKEQLSRQQQKWEKEKTKLMKRAETGEAEVKKGAAERRLLEKSLAECLRQVETMRVSVRSQGQQEATRRLLLEQECEGERRKVEAARKEIEEAQEELQRERKRIGEERRLFKEKIELVEGQLGREKQLTVGLRVELQTALTEGASLRRQLSDMNGVYQQKIGEVEQTIASIGELQKTRDRQERAISQLSLELKQSQILNAKNEQIIAATKADYNQLQLEYAEATKKAEKYKEEAQLTEGDLATLRRQVEKVSQAYLENQSALDSARQQISHAHHQLHHLTTQNTRLTRELEEGKAEVAALRSRVDAVELAERDTRDDYYQKCQQASKAQGELEENRREGQKHRKDVAEQRQARAQVEQQLREARQQLQRLRDTHAAELGKQRLQTEELRVELRRSQQEGERQREGCEERIGILNKQVKDLSQCFAEKQLLSQLLGHKSQ